MSEIVISACFGSLAGLFILAFFDTEVYQFLDWLRHKIRAALGRPN